MAACVQTLYLPQPLTTTQQKQKPTTPPPTNRKQPLYTAHGSRPGTCPLEQATHGQEHSEPPPTSISDALLHTTAALQRCTIPAHKPQQASNNQKHPQLLLLLQLLGNCTSAASSAPCPAAAAPASPSPSPKCCLKKAITGLISPSRTPVECASRCVTLRS